MYKPDKRLDHLSRACTKCHKIFSSSRNLQRHLITHQERLVSFVCTIDQCNRKFVSEWHLEKHVEFKHTRKSKPKNSSPSPKKKQDHLDSPSVSTILYECCECGVKYSSGSEYKIHLKNHRKLIQCEDDAVPLLPASTPSSTPSLVNIIRLDSESDAVECRFCNEIFDTNFSLLRHETSAHPLRYNTPKKQRQSQSKKRSESEAEDTNSFTSYYSTDCDTPTNNNEGIRISSRFDLVEHLLKYKCTVCKTYFTNKSNLDRHLILSQKHLQNLPASIRPSPVYFHCSHCPHSFTTKDNLKRHIRIKKCDMNQTLKVPEVQVVDISSDEDEEQQKNEAEGVEIMYEIKNIPNPNNVEVKLDPGTPEIKTEVTEIEQKGKRNKRKRKKSKEKSFTCSRCEKKFRSLRKLSRHFAEHPIKIERIKEEPVDNLTEWGAIEMPVAVNQIKSETEIKRKKKKRKRIKIKTEVPVNEIKIEVIDIKEEE